MIIAPQLAPGTGVGVLFLLGALLVGAWAAVAIHAWRLAARSWSPVRPGGAMPVLLLAPIAVVASSLLWGVGGRAAEPAAALEAYLEAWEAERPVDAIAHLLEAPPPGELVATWGRQRAALRNELVRLAAQAGPGAGIDPSAPIRSVRWVDAGPLAGGGRRIGIDVVRRETERGTLLGLLPTSTQRSVTLARLGHVDLRRQPVPGPLPPGPWAEAWRIAEVVVGEVTLHDATVSAAPSAP